MQYGAYTVKYWINYSIDSLRMLVTGQLGPFRICPGPVGIVNAVDDVYETSSSAGMDVLVLNLMNFAVLLTANLGVLNLLPLPAPGWRTSCLSDY